MASFILYEFAAGYALFERLQSEEVAKKASEVQAAAADYNQFSKLVKFKSLATFESAEHALENINSVSEGAVTDFLKNFLETNLKGSKNIKIGVADTTLASAIQQSTKFQCVYDDSVLELIRGVRNHLTRFCPTLKGGELEKAQLGLAHSYSRSKIKFNVNRADNMIIQSSALLDQLDKDINTFAMRVKEWYSWHFPELQKLVNDNYMFAKLAKAIRVRSTLTDDSLAELTEITGDADKSKEILDASRSSMGTDISEIDIINIEAFAVRVIQLSEYRKKLHNYLSNKMNTIAPNLTALIGEQVSARLISHAGSLTNLAKYPASTVQILGAEKALFRALKTKSNTPKYGLIFNSSFIGRASTKDKGRISRYLANKCSIASRIDCFSEQPTTVYGNKLKEQVEERLTFFANGTAPRKNSVVMKEAVKLVAKESHEDTSAPVASESKKDKKKKDKKRKTEDVEMAPVEEPVVVEESKKEKKKDKKKKHAQVEEEVVATQEMEVEAPVEKKKKKKERKD